MKGQLETNLGTVVIDEDVLGKYAGSAAVGCFGVVGMASVNMKDGIVKLLKKDNLRHGVNMSMVDGKLHVELHIIVAFGVSILAVAENLVDTVRYNLEEFTGMEIGRITVCVEGVRVVD
ncbi:MAG TPA: Asp23/Gls24 family envelope stress response protein [Lachnospiraceae bacterium]|nr:Asp23/Gls24 family envelope stress response protein [Lachnospiraceae bacterium]